MRSAPGSARRWISDRSATLSRVLIWGGWLGGALTAAGGLLLDDAPSRQFVSLYVAPIVPAVALWARERLRDLRGSSRLGFRLDAIVFTVAAVRFGTGVPPMSGHMLFLTYVLLAVPSPRYRLFALALWLETAYFKFVLWDDPASWATGLAAGLLLGLVHRFRA